MWVVSCGVAYYLFRTSANGGIEYIPKAVRDAQLSKLREALRQTAGHYHVAQKHGDGLVIAPFRDCDNPVCAAARTAMSDAGKE